MPIENRNLEPGTKLIGHYKKEEYHALMVAGEDGKVKYRLEDDREFKSPSAAGTAITRKACNGWAFWSVDHGAAPETESTTEAQAPSSETEDTTAEAPDSTKEPEPPYITAGEGFTEPAATPNFRRVPNQRSVDQGQVRLYCDTCRNSFPEDRNPETCPQGHYPGQSEPVED